MSCSVNYFLLGAGLFLWFQVQKFTRIRLDLNFAAVLETRGRIGGPGRPVSYPRLSCISRDRPGASAGESAGRAFGNHLKNIL